MDYEALKEEISQSEAVGVSSFKLLGEIARMVNHNETHNLGRDLVIRALANPSRFTDSEHEVLTNLVRSVGLFPYMTGSLSKSSFDDHLAYELHRADGLDGDIIFHSLQAKIFHQLMLGFNVVLSASTSVGKSLVIDALIASGKYKNVVVVVPTIALIDETRRRLQKRFQADCAIITHPSQQRHKDRLNVYVLTQERALQRDDLSDVDLFVVDEFYKMSLASEKDPSRSVDLNLAFHRLAKTGAQFYLLGPNVNSIKGLEKYEYHFVPSEFSTVAVDVINFGLPKGGGQRDEKLLEILRDFDGPTIVYCQSPRSASNVATLIAEHSDNVSVNGTENAIEWISENFHPEWSVTHALKHGVGVHHAGVPRALQQYFIRQFNGRKIKILVCTSTIIEGVNTVAKNVIVYDRRKGKGLLENFTYKNIEGRAGRMREHFVGRVFMLEKPIEEEEVYTVEFPIGVQGDETPESLLLDLEDEALLPGSRERLDDLFSNSSLSPETLRANRHTSSLDQERIVQAIHADLVQFEDALVWTGVPDGAQLTAVCKLIFEYLEEDLLREYGVFSGNSLAWHLNAIRSASDLSEYVYDCVADRQEKHSPSEAVENCLRFIRNIVCYRFPRDLMAIDAIQKDVFGKLGAKYGDYSLYAEQVENLFLPSPVFALDEYGIPIQTAQKLNAHFEGVETLDGVLASVFALDIDAIKLSKFEKELLNDVRAFFGVERAT